MFIIKNPDIVFIHMPKCAGDSVAHALKDKLAFYVDHAPVWKIPKIFLSHRIIGFVRHPVTWYQSFYFYMIKRIKKGATPNFNRSLVLSKNKIVSFSEYLDRALNLQDFIVPEMLEMYPATLADSKDCVCFMAETFYDFMYKLFEMDKVEKFRLEDQFQEVLDILEIDYLPRLNATKWEPQPDTDEIYKKDQKYFKLLGYQKKETKKNKRAPALL